MIWASLESCGVPHGLRRLQCSILRIVGDGTAGHVKSDLAINDSLWLVAQHAETEVELNRSVRISPATIFEIQSRCIDP